MVILIGSTGKLTHAVRLLNGARPFQIALTGILMAAPGA